ncbi:MAG: hypothetical protein ACK5GN_04655 [Pseudomonadota bacterium]|jgi:hypothetical protein
MEALTVTPNFPERGPTTSVQALQNPCNQDVPLPGGQTGGARLFRPFTVLSRRFTVAGVVSFVLLALYGIAFVKSLQGRWFNPIWTTDDATQQTYPLYDALYPDVFQDDLVSEVMRGCLPTLHYYVGYGITLLTRDPIMTGHWMMLLQVSLALGALFMAVRAMSSTVPAAVAVLWLLHSRNTMQRMTGGLPRGWTPAIFGAFLYFAAKSNHRGALATILLGAMLNPPGALIVGVAYGLVMLWRFMSARGAERLLARQRIVRSLVLAPLFVVVALLVVQRPPHIGQMVSFSEASQMPEFSRPHGRFPFLPLRPALEEVKLFGYQAFIGRLYRPTEFWRSHIWWMVPGALALLAIVGMRRRRVALPSEIVLFGAASVITYSLARVFAFRLFVPDRHLQIPMVFFMVSAFTVGVWRVFIRRDPNRPESALRSCWPALIALAGLAGVVYQCSGDGLQGDANFNYPSTKRGGMYQWVRENTPQESLVACHPTHCDGMQLFGVRRALVTTETSHPFYPRYNLEMRRRSELSLRAHYAESLEDVVALLEPEGVTHFVFRRADFRSENITRASYFPPLDRVVKELVKRPSGRFAFDSLPKALDPNAHPYVKFVDDVSIIVDVKALGDHLRSRGWSPPQASFAASLQRHALSRRTLLASGSVDPDEFPS